MKKQIITGMLIILSPLTNPDYSAKCLQAALKCLDWCIRTMKDANAAVIRESMQAAQQKKIQAEDQDGNTAADVDYSHKYLKERAGKNSFGIVPYGFGGDSADQAVIGNGNWQISEYWTPMVAYTLWLMAEISETE